MTVEFISAVNVNPANELNRLGRATIYPTVAAKALATLDQFGPGRAVVHFISGGSDAEQAREGDHLPKDQRYARTAEYIDIVRRAWTSTEPFSHEGEYYRHILPLVRQELTHRQATGQHGNLQQQYPGAYAERTPA